MQVDSANSNANLCAPARTRIGAGGYDGARSYLQAAQRAAGDMPPPEMLRLLADLTAQLEDFDQGVQLMIQALDGFRLAEDYANEVITAGDLAALLQRNGHLARARLYAEWALAHVAVDDRAQRARLPLSGSRRGYHVLRGSASEIRV